MTDKSDLRTIASLMGDALAQFSKLFQNEVDLAKAELGEKAQQVGVAAGLLVGAAVLVIPAIIMALLALAAALMKAGWSDPPPTCVAALAAAPRRLFIAYRLQKLKPENLKPTRPSINSSATSRR